MVMCCAVVYFETLCWALGVLLSSGSSGPSPLGKFDFRVLSVMVSNVPLFFSVLDVRYLYLTFFFLPCRHVFSVCVCMHVRMCVGTRICAGVHTCAHVCYKTEADISVEAESLSGT